MRARMLMLTAALILAGCGSVVDEETGSTAPNAAPTQSESPADILAPGSSDSPLDLSDDDTDGFGILPEPQPEETPTLGREPESSDSDSEGPQDSGESPTEDRSKNGEPSMGAAMSGLPTDPANPGFRLGPTFTNENGTFHRIVMPDSYDRIRDSVIVSGADVSVSGTELVEALVLTGRFAAEELAASELAFDYTTEGAKAWLEDHSSIFVYPELVEAGLLDTDSPNQSLAVLYTDNGWDRGAPENPSRIQNLAVQLVSVKQDGDQLVISHLVTFEAEVSGTGGLSGTFTEQTRIHATYTVEQVDGRWKIADYETTWDTRY